MGVHRMNGYYYFDIRCISQEAHVHDNHSLPRPLYTAFHISFPGNMHPLRIMNEVYEIQNMWVEHIIYIIMIIINT